MKLSSRLDRFNEPETLKMAKLGRELRSKGLDIIDLSLGEPDFDTPAHIKEAGKRAIDENYSHYPPVAGYMDLREAVCHKFKRDNNLEFKPENIIVSTGAKQSLANAVLAITDVDDEVIIPTPYWVTYSEIVKLGQGKPVFIPGSPENRYKITPEQLEAAITPQSKLFIFSSPCNPTGAVYSQSELEGLVNVFRKHPQVFIISDEIYEYINYSGKHVSIASFEDIRDRVVIINGLSKAFAMTGWRLGYIAAHADIAKACEKLQGQFTSGTSTISQRAAITALNSDPGPSMEMVKEFQKRKLRVMELVSQWPGVTCPEPDGAFYIFPIMKHYFGKSYNDIIINDASDLSMFLLNEGQVTTVTGSAFGGPDCIRISFANAMDKIEGGFKRIAETLAKLK